MSLSYPGAISYNYSRYFAGFWLIFVTSLSVFLVVYSLSAFQIQARIQAFSASGQSFSVWNIKRLNKRRLARATLIEPASANVVRIQKALNEKKAELEAVSILKRPIDDEIFKYERDIGSTLRRNGIPFEVVSDDDFSDTYAKIVEQNAKLKDDSQIDKVTIDNYKKAVDDSNALYAQQLPLKDKIAEIENELQSAVTKLEDSEKSAESIFGLGSQISISDQEKIEDFLDELNVLQSKFGFLRFMTEVPAELLTIIIVICAGILGSSLYLTQAFFAESTSFGLGFYLFRPFSGALTALALFVVVKAGVIVAIDPFQLSKSGATLNPFFVSFIGIIGGLISEQAIERIKASSQVWLRTSALGRNRWAVGVNAEMTKQNKSIADLSKFFDVGDQTLSEWVEERRDVPPDAQRTIAAWLGMPERVLFTDIPPKEHAEDLGSGAS